MPIVCHFVWIECNARRWTTLTTAKNVEMVFIEERSQGNCKAFSYIAIRFMYMLQSCTSRNPKCCTRIIFDRLIILPRLSTALVVGQHNTIFPLQSDGIPKTYKTMHGSCIRAWKVMPSQKIMHHIEICILCENKIYLRHFLKSILIIVLWLL